MKLKQIHLKKFRSIENCIIDFDSEIKVLIGPNGSGKTNLLLALRFLSSCINHSPIRAIQQAGGLDKVFTIRERRAKELSVQVIVQITKDSGSLSFPKATDEVIGDACYSFSLQFEENSSVLIVRNEKLVFTPKNFFDNVEVFNRKSDTQKTKIESSIRRIDKEVESEVDVSVPVNELAIGKLFYSLERAAMLGDAKIKSKLSDAYLTNLTVLRQILIELSSINGYNFDPSELRKSSDLLSSENISYSGRGFASFLQRLSNNTYTQRSKYSRIHRRSLNSDFLAKLNDVYQDILPFLTEITPIENIDTTTVELKFKEIQQVDSPKTFSTVHLSDGSLKFLAIVTSILIQNYSLLFIEEIENYLNPSAIKRLLQLMKDTSESTGRSFLITSHSETVLNAMDPEDVLISRRQRTGATTYEKFRNLENIKKAVDEGGFGLGYLWGRGGLDGF